MQFNLDSATSKSEKGHSANYSAMDLLRDGRQVLIRAIRPADKSILEDEMRHLSPDSRYFRFFIPKRKLTEQDLKDLTEIDFVNHVGLLASVISDGYLVPAGVGRYIRLPGENKDQAAELGFEVKDEFQGMGIATVLLRHLTDIARHAGLQFFKAYVMADNIKMRHVFEHSGLPLTQTRDSEGILEMDMKLSAMHNALSLQGLQLA